MKFIHTLFAALFFSCIIHTSNAQQNLPKENPATTKSNSKISPALQLIYNGVPEKQKTEPGVPFINTDLYVIQNGKVRIEASAISKGVELERQLKGISATEISVYKRIVNAWIPIKNIMRLEELTELQYADVVYKVTPDIGSVDSEADSAMASKLAKRTYCLDGNGVKIGVISDSYNFLGGAPSGVSSGDLPGATNPNGYTTPVTVVADWPSGIDEGRAMCELVHDVAPGSELFFSTANGGQASFANAILALDAVHHCDVIVDDIRYFTEPFYMDGVIAQACDKVFDNGVPYFASAGNYAQSSYEAPYFENRGSRWHDFDPGLGVDTMQSISVAAGSSINLTLQWDDPFGSITPNSPATDLDLYIYNSTGTVALLSSIDDNVNVTLEPVEFISASSGGSGTVTFNIAIRRFSGPWPSSLKWVIRNASGLVINEFSTPTINGQSTGYGHSNADGANAVGACWWGQSPAYGVNPPLPEPFTSSGGVQIRYDTNGVALATPITRPKPNFTAIDGVSNTFFGSGNKFFGTSAAAPNAAAVAGLMLEADSTLTPTEVRTMLANSAIDMSTAGFDYLTGTGLIQADSALAQVYKANCSIDSISLVNGPILEPGDTSYTVTLRVHYRNNIGTDTLEVAGQKFAANMSGTQDVTLTGLPADGAPVLITAAFKNNPLCGISVFAPYVTPTPPAVIALDTLVITEIMYNSPVSGSDSLEYIEIHNPTAAAINLNGYYFFGVNYTFGNVSIPAGGYVVVCESSSALLSQYGAFGYQWSGALTNTGELLLLKDALGRTVDSVEYDNISPWPTAANGSGSSLVLCDPDLDNAVAANWTVSTQNSGKIINGMALLGSPGSADKACSLCPFDDSTTVHLITCDSTQAGTTITTLQNSSGCDSVVTTIRTFDPGAQTVLSSMTICSGDSLLIFGVYRKTAGTYYDTLPNINGCDSIIEKALNVNPVDTTQLSATTTDPTQAGIVTQVLTGTNGCDSIIITTTVYVPDPCATPDSTYETVFTCDVSLAGVATATYTGSDSCDSLHTVTTIYDPGSTTSLPAIAICEGDSLMVFGVYRTMAGTYYDTLPNINGCDSIINKAVSVNTIDTTQLSLTTTDPGQAGISTQVLTGSNGCDSIVITTTVYVPLPSVANLRVTEIMYNSPEGGSDTLEFVEVYNAGAAAVNLNGYAFTEGISYTFGNVVLPSGNYVVVAGDSMALFNTFGVSAYEWSGILSNSGEDIVLKDDLNRTLDSVEYDNNGSWPSANGTGPSIVLCDLNVDQNDGSNWKASTSGTGIISAGGEIKGSPGVADPACAGPVNCQLSPWSSWSACDTTCGGGQQFRTRTIIVQGSNGGTVCDSTDLIEFRACNTQPCPLDCQVSAWSAWSACDTSCGGGTRFRTRTIVVPSANGGAACPSLIEYDTCNTQPCAVPVNCVLSPWSGWSACDTTCGGGQQFRTRTILVQGSGGGIVCDSTDLIEYRACNTQPCPVDCQVSAWSAWSACDTSCGGGTRFRTRTIVVPSANGGAACPSLIEYDTCNTQPCPVPVNCQLSPWSAWSACDTTCGGGQQFRTRTILVQGSGGGIVCDSTDLIEYRACNTQPCPVDCQVSAWSAWSACDTSCGGGTRFRTRTIVVPAANGGAACPSLIEYDTCNTQPCAAANTTSLVSDSGWTLSTVVTTATANSYPWPGVSSVPPVSTFVLPAIIGQPYPWEHIYTVEGSQVIKAESGVTYYRKTFELTDHTDLNARFRMYVDDNMQVFINGKWIVLEDDMGVMNWRTVNHDILFKDDGSVMNPNSGGDPFDYYTTSDLDSVFKTGANDVVLAIRNRTSKPDKGGFSFRMDLDKGGLPVIVEKGGAASSGVSIRLIPQVIVYPNPTTGVVNITTTGVVDGEVLELNVYDVSGKLLINTTQVYRTTSENQIDLLGLASGIYTLKIKTTTVEISKPIMVH